MCHSTEPMLLCDPGVVYFEMSNCGNMEVKDYAGLCGCSFSGDWHCLHRGWERDTLHRCL